MSEKFKIEVIKILENYGYISKEGGRCWVKYPSRVYFDDLNSVDINGRFNNFKFITTIDRFIEILGCIENPLSGMERYQDLYEQFKKEYPNYEEISNIHGSWD